MKKSILHIYNKTFLQFIEKALLDDTSKDRNITFEDFDTSLWQFLCQLKWNEKIRLSNQLKKDDRYNSKTNIGNIRERIYNDLNINFIRC